jgi:predicted NBD/HSP70 family sugar kinase
MTNAAAGARRRATPAMARVINDRLALELLLARGPLTAAQLKGMTGLSRPTISELIVRLQESGLVTVAGESDAVRRGPNARLYELVADRAHVAGVDVRTDSVRLVVADITGATLTSASVEVNHRRTAVGPMVDTLADAVRRSGDDPLHTVAVGAPGLVDPATGELRTTAGLPRWHAELVDALRRRLRAPVILENEVNLAALAELRQGAGRDRDTFVLLWLGHGVGAGAVLDGRLRRGASGGTGELGFLAVPGTGGLPSATGCEHGFHALASSGAVCALARRHGIETPDGDAAAEAEAAVRSALTAGPRGERFLGELAGHIALGAQAVCLVLDPGCLVLGGEVGRAGGPELADRVAARLAELSPLSTEVRPAQVPGSAVLAGAVLTALDAAHADLFGPPPQPDPHQPG